MASSTPIDAPSSAAARTKTASAIFSLSTNTPSESKMISSVTTDPPLVADVEFGTNCFNLIPIGGDLHAWRN